MLDKKLCFLLGLQLEGPRQSQHMISSRNAQRRNNSSPGRDLSDQVAPSLKLHPEPPTSFQI